MELTLAEASDDEGAAVEFAGEPLAREGKAEEGGSERSADVRAALAPVKTGIGEAAALGAGSVEFDTEGGEDAGSFGGEVVCGKAGGGETGAAGAREGLDPARAQELIVEGDGDGASHVVVAGARGAEMLGGMRKEGAGSAAGEDAEALEGTGDVGRGERVVAMAALHKHFDQVF